MKTVLTLLLITVCSFAFGQVEKKIILSKGEVLRERNWQALSKFYAKQDSSHKEFMNTTIGSNLLPGDTIASWRFNSDFTEILYTLKPKKK